MATAHEWLREDLLSLKTSVGDFSETATSIAAYADSTVPDCLFALRQPQPHRRRGAPGLVASSRSSEDILERTTLALSPVTGPGATTFSSVASAFDFQHHIGSDPTSELLVLKRILRRECLLSQLEAMCGQIRKRCRRPRVMIGGVKMPLGDSADKVMYLLSSLREATVAVVEAVTLWRDEMTERPPPAFVWHGENYLLKITNDLNFLAGVEPLVAALKMHPARFCRNPLMLPQTLDEQRRDGEVHEADVDMSSPRAQKRRYLYEIAQVFLDEEGLESDRELLREDPHRTTNARSSRGETSPALGGRRSVLQSCEDGLGARAGDCGRSCTADSIGGTRSQTNGAPATRLPSCRKNRSEQEDELRRQQQLSTWYEKARSQMISLSSSPADEEYFLSSRRFWSKEELREARACGQQSPPPLRRLSTLGRSKSQARTRSSVDGEASEQGAIALRRRKGVRRDRTDRTGRIPKDVGLYGQGLPNPQNGPDHQGRFSQSRPTELFWKPRGGDGDKDEGQARPDVWSRPEDDGQWDESNSTPLSSLTAEHIEQLLKEENPLPATTVVCAAIVFILAPDDQVPEDFCWPRGFEAIALPAEDFLLRLEQTSGRAISSFKARVLRFVLQREDLLPAVIDEQGGHAVASLCAWALEELRGCEEFAEWSRFALEPWYQRQLTSTPAEVHEKSEGLGPGAMLVYKSLHKLSNDETTYVLSLFEDGDGDGGLTVRAFDRVRPQTLWLWLSKKQISSFAGNAMRSPAHFAAVLARRVKVKVDSATSIRRLVLPPVKGGGSDRKAGSRHEKESRHRRVGRGDDATTPAMTEETASTRNVPQPPPSQVPSTTGSMTDDFGPLVGGGVDAEDESIADGKQARNTTQQKADSHTPTDGVSFERKEDVNVPPAGVVDGPKSPELAPENRGKSNNEGNSWGVLEETEAVAEDGGCYDDDFGHDDDDERASSKGAAKRALADTAPVDTGGNIAATDSESSATGLPVKTSIEERKHRVVHCGSEGVTPGGVDHTGTLDEACAPSVKVAVTTGETDKRQADNRTPLKVQQESVAEEPKQAHSEHRGKKGDGIVGASEGHQLIGGEGEDDGYGDDFVEDVVGEGGDVETETEPPTRLSATVQQSKSPSKENKHSRKGITSQSQDLGGGKDPPDASSSLESYPLEFDDAPVGEDFDEFSEESADEGQPAGTAPPTLPLESQQMQAHVAATGAGKDLGHGGETVTDDVVLPTSKESPIESEQPSTGVGDGANGDAVPEDENTLTELSVPLGRQLCTFSDTEAHVEDNFGKETKNAEKTVSNGINSVAQSNELGEEVPLTDEGSSLEEHPSELIHEHRDENVAVCCEDDVNNEIAEKEASPPLLREPQQIQDDFANGGVDEDPTRVVQVTTEDEDSHKNKDTLLAENEVLDDGNTPTREIASLERQPSNSSSIPGYSSGDGFDSDAEHVKATEVAVARDVVSSGREDNETGMGSRDLLGDTITPMEPSGYAAESRDGSMAVDGQTPDDFEEDFELEEDTSNAEPSQTDMAPVDVEDRPSGREGRGTGCEVEINTASRTDPIPSTEISPAALEGTPEKGNFDKGFEGEVGSASASRTYSGVKENVLPADAIGQQLILPSHSGEADTESGRAGEGSIADSSIVEEGTGAWAVEEGEATAEIGSPPIEDAPPDENFEEDFEEDFEENIAEVVEHERSDHGAADAAASATEVSSIADEGERHGSLRRGDATEESQLEGNQVEDQKRDAARRKSFDQDSFEDDFEDP